MQQSLSSSRFQKLIETERSLNLIQDVDVMLEKLLSEARKIVHADAGSIYICDKDEKRLYIKYSQNDTKQKTLAPGEKLPYNFYNFPVNENSISGYSLLKREILNIADVYTIPEDSVYKFNKLPDFDSNYRTKSMLTIPLVIAGGRALGVLQIINAQDDNGNIVEFTHEDELFIQHFSESATRALERAFITETMVLRMARMAEMRDPKETGPHVTRVSMFSKEIYDQWAFDHGVPLDEREHYRDNLAIASKLHDVGKVAIPDNLLKTPRAFTDEEHNLIKQHTYVCEFLFDSPSALLDKMAKDIAIRHHEYWDGNGYPGKFDETKITGPQVILDLKNVEKIKGDEIPLSARIVSVADVFDALSHKRYYKDAWSEEDVLNEIKKQSGKQFDPEVVTAFFEAYPRIKEIAESFES